jgi:hypothetical protein
MKSIILTLITLAFTSSQILGQNIQFDWNNIIGSSGNNIAKSIISDENGYLYVAGEFYGDLILGDSVVTGLADRNIFIFKLDLDGNLIWSRSLGSNTPISLGQICFDTSMNIVCTGTFSNTLLLNDTTITSNGGTDIFLLKVKNTGETISINSDGGIGDENSNSLCVNKNNDLYICGGFSGTSSFGDITMTSYGYWQYTPWGDYVYIDVQNAFFAKYDSQNNCIFAKQVTENRSDLYSILTDSDNNIYTTGYFSGYDAITDTVAQEVGEFLVFKYNQNGEFVNLIQEGSDNNYIKGKSLAIDNEDNLYISGYIGCHNCMFGDSLIPDSHNDAFLVKYNSQGDMDWINLIGQYHGDYDGNENSGNSIVIDKNNDVILTGYFDGIELNGEIILGNGIRLDILLMKFNQNGEIITIGKYGYPSWDKGESITIDSSNNIYIVGITYLNNMSSDLPSYIFIAKVDTVYPLLNIDINTLDQVNIYPNPSSGLFNIDLPSNFNQKATIIVCNVEGKILFTSNVTQKHNEILLQGIKPGLYLVKILIKDKIYFKKLLIQ